MLLISTPFPSETSKSLSSKNPIQEKHRLGFKIIHFLAGHTIAGHESEEPSLHSIIQQGLKLQEKQKRDDQKFYFPLSVQHKPLHTTQKTTAPFKAPGKLAKLVPTTSMNHKFPHPTDYKERPKPLFRSQWQTPIWSPDSWSSGCISPDTFTFLVRTFKIRDSSCMSQTVLAAYDAAACRNQPSWSCCIKTPARLQESEKAEWQQESQTRGGQVPGMRQAAREKDTEKPRKREQPR